MADISNNSWEEEDNLNNSPAPNGLPTGESPSKLAPTVRDMRGAIKRSWKRINPILVSSGTASAWALAYEVDPTEYVKGEVFSFFSHVENAGALTLNINGLGAKSIVRNDGIALAAGQIKSGQVVTVAYDGTCFRLQTSIINNPVFSGVLTAQNVAVSGEVATGTLNTSGVITAESIVAESASFSGAVVANSISGNGSNVSNVNALTLETKGLSHVLSRSNHTGTQDVSTISGLVSALSAMVPAGTIFPTAIVGTVPTGFLFCYGQAVSRVTYAALFAAIGTTYGAGDGSTTFNIPDFRGVFLRGWDNGRGFDASRVFGSYQADENKEHTHAINDPGHTHAIPTSPIGSGNSSTGRYVGGSNTSSRTASSSTGITIKADGSDEARPKNVAINYMIKF